MHAVAEISANTGLKGLRGGSDRKRKVFFCGGLSGAWMSGWQRCECLKELGHWVVPFNQDSYVHRALRRSPLLQFHLSFYDEQVVSEFNRDLLAALLATRPQVAWLE